MATSDAPLKVETVTLTVADLPGLVRFYEEALGLATLSGEGAEATLGAGGRPLLVLRADPAATPAAPGEAGLFHVAFLLPSRGDLGAWLGHARAAGIPLTGAADHAVSEALYLSDPEGNGLEIYADRPREAWPRADGFIPMSNAPIDLDALAADAADPWRGAPEGTVVGHVHLRVGDLSAADGFWSGTLGLALTHRVPAAHFFGSGGYHHHVAVNAWRSAGAGPRPEGRLGLAEVGFSAAAGAMPAGAPPDGPVRLVDPSGLAHVVAPREV